MKKRTWLSLERAKKGLTQNELAERLGMKQAQYSRYETGRSEPSAFNKIKIAEALGFSLELWEENK